MLTNDLKKIYSEDPQWYKKIWTLDIQGMSWVEQTKSQVDFLWELLQLDGNEKVLDLACGFGRHSLELASRGCRVVGVDLTRAYIGEARKQARERHLKAEFICADLRQVQLSYWQSMSFSLLVFNLGRFPRSEPRMQTTCRSEA